MPSLAAKVLVVPHHTNWVLLSPGSAAVEEVVATEGECECAPSSQFEGQVASLPVPHLRVPLGIPAAPLLIQCGPSVWATATHKGFKHRFWAGSAPAIMVTCSVTQRMKTCCFSLCLSNKLLEIIKDRWCSKLILYLQHSIWVPVHVPAAPLPIQFSAYNLGKQWIVTQVHMADPEEAPVSWLWISSAPWPCGE